MPGFVAIDATLPLPAGVFFRSGAAGLTPGALISNGSAREPLHSLRRIAQLTVTIII